MVELKNNILEMTPSLDFGIKIQKPIPLDKVFSFGMVLPNGEKLTEELLFSGKEIDINGKYYMTYKETFNKVLNEKYYVIIFRSYDDEEFLANFSLDDQRKNIKEIKRCDAKNITAATISFLAELQLIGIITKDVLKILGLSEEKIKDVQKQIAKEELILNKINELNKSKPGINNLPYTTSCNAKSPYFVYQGEGVVLDVNDKHDALYTFGAGPCSILIVTAKDKAGNVSKMGLAHIDGGVNKDHIKKFLEKFEGNIEVSVISGDKNKVFNVLVAIREAGLENKICYFDVDLKGDRSDAITIDKKGKIYYGDNPNWNRLYDNKKMELREIRIQMPQLPGLDIKEINADSTKSTKKLIR